MHRPKNDEERDKIILDLISKRPHEGCSPESVFSAVEDLMARQTYFRRLAALKSKKILREERVNRRDKLLFINNEDLIVRVTNEIDLVETAYFKMLRNVIASTKTSDAQFARSYFRSNREYDVSERLFLVRKMLRFFREILDHYMGKIVFKWPNVISDKKYLGRLQATTSLRLSKMLPKLIELLNECEYPELNQSVGSRRPLDNLDAINLDYDFRNVSEHMLRLFEEYTFKDEALSVLNRMNHV